MGEAVREGEVFEPRDGSATAAPRCGVGPERGVAWHVLARPAMATAAREVRFRDGDRREAPRKAWAAVQQQRSASHADDDPPSAAAAGGR